MPLVMNPRSPHLQPLSGPRAATSGVREVLRRFRDLDLWTHEGGLELGGCASFDLPVEGGVHYRILPPRESGQREGLLSLVADPERAGELIARFLPGDGSASIEARCTLALEDLEHPQLCIATEEPAVRAWLTRLARGAGLHGAA